MMSALRNVWAETVRDMVVFTVVWLAFAFVILATATTPAPPLLVVVYFYESLKILWEGFNKARLVETYSCQ